jgi:hypothetical protein
MRGSIKAYRISVRIKPRMVATEVRMTVAITTG